MTREQLHQFFKTNGWFMKPNSLAYYKDGHPTLRYKVNKLVLRKEVRLATGEWARIKSAYISQLEIVNDKLAGMKAS